MLYVSECAAKRVSAGASARRLVRMQHRARQQRAVVCSVFERKTTAQEAFRLAHPCNAISLALSESFDADGSRAGDGACADDVATNVVIVASVDESRVASSAKVSLRLTMAHSVNRANAQEVVVAVALIDVEAAPVVVAAAAAAAVVVAAATARSLSTYAGVKRSNSW